MRTEPASGPGQQWHRAANRAEMAPHMRRTNQSLRTRGIAGLWLTEGQSCSLPAHERQSGQTWGVKRQGTAHPYRLEGWPAPAWEGHRQLGTWQELPFPTQICWNGPEAGACLEKGSSPEEGVMLYADLPETLGRAVVGQLEANGALKLLVLRGDRDMLLQADPALEDTVGWDLPCQGPQVALAGAMTQKTSSKQCWKVPCPAPLGGRIIPPKFLA